MSNPNIASGLVHGALGRAKHDPAALAGRLRASSFVDEDAIPEPPSDVGFGRHMTSIPMLGNDRYGCCVWVTIMHAVQAITAAMGRERVFTEEECLRAYETTGFDRTDPSTDNGSNMLVAIDACKRDPDLIGGFEIEGSATIEIDDWENVQQWMWLGGVVLAGFDLPRISQRQIDWRLEMGAGEEEIERGTWGGHAFMFGDRVIVNSRPRLKAKTWGRDQMIYPAYNDFYGAEGHMILLKGQEPAYVPGFDRDRMLRAMRELRS